MTLPSASTLTDEQLRVLCAEARGWKRYTGTTPTYGGTYKPSGWIKPDGKFVFHLPDYLTDANAALRLLEKDNWNSVWDTSTATVAIFRPGKTYIGEAPAFCRAVVLLFLRAEGKIL